MLDKKETGRESTEGKKGIDYNQMYSETFKTRRQGQIVKGKIINISKKEIVVDIGFKSEGAISLIEFPDRETLKLGDEIEVLIEKLEDDEGMVVLSRNKAERIIGWERIINIIKRET